MAEVIGVTRNDDTPTEANRCRDHQRVDRRLAPGAGGREEVPGDSCRSSAGGDNLREAPTQDGVDRLVDATTPVELNEHHRRNPDRRVQPVSTTHGSADSLVPHLVHAGAGQR